MYLYLQVNMVFEILFIDRDKFTCNTFKQMKSNKLILVALKLTLEEQVNLSLDLEM